MGYNMPDNENDQGTQGQGTDDQQGGGTGSQEGQGASDGGGRRIDLPPEAQALVDRTIEEAKQARQRAQAAEAKVAEYENAGKSAQEKAEQQAAEALKRAEAAEARLREVTVGQAVTSVASDLGFHKPGLAGQLVDLSKFETDDEGKVDRKAVQAALEDVLKEHPYLAGRRTADSGKGSQGGGGNGASMNDLIRRRAGR